MTDAVGGVDVYVEEPQHRRGHLHKGYNAHGRRQGARLRPRAPRSSARATSPAAAPAGVHQGADAQGPVSKGTLTNPVTLAKLRRRRHRRTSPSTRASRWPMRSRGVPDAQHPRQRHRLHHGAVHRLRHEPGGGLDRHRRRARGCRTCRWRCAATTWRASRSASRSPELADEPQPQARPRPRTGAAAGQPERTPATAGTARLTWAAICTNTSSCRRNGSTISALNRRPTAD